MKKDKKTIIIIIFLVVICSIWLFSKGIVHLDDIDFHVGRIEGLANTIRNGDFLAYIHDTLNGYGYPSGIFYSNFFIYIPAILNILGISSINSFKILIILLNIITVINSYICFSKLLKKKETILISTFLYTLSSYRLANMFVRGAIGELTAQAFIPFIILGLYELIYGDYKKWYYFAIGFVLVFLSHNITTILFAVFSVILMLINYKRFIKEKDRIKYVIISGVVGLSLGAFTLLPMIEGLMRNNIFITNLGSLAHIPHENAVNILLSMIFTINGHPSLGYNIGYRLLLLIPIYFIYRKEKKKKESIVSFANILFVSSIILFILSSNIIPWELFEKYISFIQFPSRLYVILSPCIIISIGIYYERIKNKKGISIARGFYVFVGIMTIILLSTYTAITGFSINRLNKIETDIGDCDYLLMYSNLEDPTFRTNNNDIKYVMNRKGKDIELIYSNNNMDNSYIDIPVYNYYGYKVEGAILSNGENNTIRLNLKDKEGKVKVYYGGTKIQKISLIYSVIFFIGLVIFFIKKKDKVI